MLVAREDGASLALGSGDRRPAAVSSTIVAITTPPPRIAPSHSGSPNAAAPITMLTVSSCPSSCAPLTLVVAIAALFVAGGQESSETLLRVMPLAFGPRQVRERPG
jgi:hypothetical protein